MSLILETMMVDIGSDGKVGGEIEYEVDEFYGLDDAHSKHFPYSSSPGYAFTQLFHIGTQITPRRGPTATPHPEPFCPVITVDCIPVIPTLSHCKNRVP